MKIIHISSYFPPHLGGQENVAKELSQRLAKKSHHVEVFTSDIGCPKNKRLKSTKNLKIDYLPAWEFAHTPIIPSLFFKLLKIPKDSIMHVHVAQAFVPEIVYKIWKKRKMPYIAQIHCDAEPSSRIGKIILNPYKNFFLKRFLKNAKIILVLTEDYKVLIHKKYKINKNKIKVIPNGIGEEFFTKKYSKNKIPHLLFVGRFTIEKNVPILIGAIDLLKNYNFKLYLIGNGELKEELKNLVKHLKLESKVIFTGELFGKRLYNQYLNSDILILPSKKESFGIVLLEAMTTGTPIIASDIPGIRSVVKNNYNGLLVKPTPKNIAEAIEKLIKNPKLRRRLAKNGLKEVKKYSWNKIVKQTEQVYREVLKEHNKKLNLKHEIKSKI